MCALILSLAALGWMLAAAVMALLWLWHLRLHNAGIMDSGWAFLVGRLAVFDAVFGDGRVPRRAFSPFEFIAATLWIVGFAGEMTADRQLERVKLSRASQPWHESCSG